jgi:multiple sugar transport system substrate-binding protein
MSMGFAFVWPGVEADANVGGGKSGYFANPKGPSGQFAQLGGQGISVVAYSDKQDAALEYIKWFAKPEVQSKWWELGGYSALNAVVEDPSFATSQPYAQAFLDSMAIVKDFWAEPSYAELLLAMQARMHNYAIAGDGTAKEALDGLVRDWTEIFEEEGKL